MNELGKETSLYLRQHATNPVHWKPWCKSSLDLAKQEDKLIVVSIGYSSCHWCHVMEHESFEDIEVAEVMNDRFVSIKVDREERPDVDHAFMDAVHLMGGQGGWPLNVVTLPDGRPVWGGTYFPKDRWVSILNQLAELFSENRDQMLEYATKLTNGVRSMGIVPHSADNSELPNWPELIERIKLGFDHEFGGRRGAPKFPMPEVLNFLTHYHATNSDLDVWNHVRNTLTQMALGGIYDQVGGGFARYSVDEFWKVPHFEKMLYDNAQLLETYANAFKVEENDLFKRVVIETADWLEREMLIDNKGFASALDADSENRVEGDFYSWTSAELKECLGEEATDAISYWQVLGKGFWEEGKSILLPISEKSHPKAESWKEKMLDFRIKHKSPPQRDNKVITSWNALAVKGFLRAYEVTKKRNYLDRALEITRAIKAHFKKMGFLSRLMGGTSEGFLDDYATVLDALLEEFQITGDFTTLETAQAIANYVLEHFSVANSPLFQYAKRRESGDDAFAQKVDYQDNVIPSPNSILATALFKLGKLSYKTDYIETSKRMLKAVSSEVKKSPDFYSKWAGLLGLHTHDFYEVVITGPNAPMLSNELNGIFWPNKVVIPLFQAREDYELTKGRFSETQDQVFVCSYGACQLPVATINEVLQQVDR